MVVSLDCRFELRFLVYYIGEILTLADRIWIQFDSGKWPLPSFASRVRKVHSLYQSISPKDEQIGGW